MAAACLRRAIATMQSRISELRGDEYREKQQKAHDDIRLTQDIHEVEFDAVRKSDTKNKTQQEVSKDTIEAAKLVAKGRALHQERAIMDGNIERHVSGEEKEIRSLESQIDQLKKIADLLERWHG